MTLFQIVVVGQTKNFGDKRDKHTIRSKRVFRSRAQAEAEAEAFGKRCCGDGIADLESIDETRIIELELVDEPTTAKMPTCLECWNDGVVPEIVGGFCSRCQRDLRASGAS